MDSDWDNFTSKLKEMGAEKILKMYQDIYDALPDNQKGLDKSLGF